MSRLTSLVSAPTYRYIQGAILVVLGIAFVTSFRSGSAGALALGYPTGFQAAFPLVCDIVAAVATVIHGRVRADRSMRRLAAWFVSTPMALSWAANAVDHVQAAPPAAAWHPAGQYAWIGGVVLAAGLCPVAVAALLHLSTKFVDYEQRQARETQPETTTGTPAVVETRETPVEAPAPAPDIARTETEDALVSVDVSESQPEKVEPPALKVALRPISETESQSAKHAQAIAYIRANPGRPWNKELQHENGISRATYYRALRVLRDETAVSA